MNLCKIEELFLLVAFYFWQMNMNLDEDDRERPAKSSSWSTIALLSFSSFGSHFARHALAVLGVFMIQSNFITTYGLTLLFTSLSAPACILPLVIGHIIDSTHQTASLGSLLLFTTLLSEIMLTLSLQNRSYPFALLSQLLLGCGSTSFTIIQRSLISHSLEEQTGLSIAFTIAASNVGKVIGKISVAPMEYLTGGYVWASSLCIVACGGSWIAWLLLSRKLSAESQIEYTQAENPNELNPLIKDRPRRVSSIRNSTTFFSEYGLLFGLLLLVHTIYTTLFHIFLNFFPHYATEKWNITVNEAALISALPTFVMIFITPLVGIVFDRIEYLVMPLCLFAAVATSTGYYLLFLTDATSPQLEVSLLAISHAVLTTFALTKLSKVVSFNTIGKAFGMIEICDAFGGLLGNYSFGYVSYIHHSYSLAACGLVMISIIGGISLVSFFLVARYFPNNFRSINIPNG